MRPKVLLFAKQQQLSLLSNLYRNCVQTLSNVCGENAARALYFRVLDVFSFLAMAMFRHANLSSYLAQTS